MNEFNRSLEGYDDGKDEYDIWTLLNGNKDIQSDIKLRNY